MPRRAQRGGVKLRIAQAHIGDAIERRCRNDAAKCARCGEAHIVGDDQQNVWRALWRHHLRLPVGGGVESIEVDRAAECAGRRRYLPPVDCRRRTGRTRRARHLCGHRHCAAKRENRANERRQQRSIPTHRNLPDELRPSPQASGQSRIDSAQTRGEGRSNSTTAQQMESPAPSPPAADSICRSALHPSARRGAW